MDTTDAPDTTRPTPLRRSADCHVIAGVAGGIARYLDVDVALVRVALVVLALLGGIGVPLYLACWLLIPAEGADCSIAEDVLDRDWSQVFPSSRQAQ